jgi:hypothetical protein
MRNITVAITAGHLLPARIWPAKHMTSVSRIVAKTARQIAEQSPTGVKLWAAPNQQLGGHSFTVPQTPQAHPPAYPIVATIEAPYCLYAEELH